MRIKAAVLPGPKASFVVEDLELDDPREGEVLVRISASGVCHSDWHLASGDTRHPMPCVAGHEGAGVVEAVGPDVADLEAGDHVVLNWAPSCGTCFYCHRGRSNLCEMYVEPIWAGTMLDGRTRLHRSGSGEAVYHYCGLATFAERVVVPRVSVVPIRRDVSLESAALVGCAVATGVGAAMFTAAVRPGESVAVIGCGGVGLNIIQGSALCGAGSIIAIDSSLAKLAMVGTFGATEALHSPPDSWEATLQRVRQRCGGRGPDHVFEAVGIPALQEIALQMARPGGTVTLAGLSPMSSATNLPGAVITRQEKTIKGSYYGTVHAARDFPMLLDLHAAGKLKLDELISRRWRLEQVNEAFAAMLAGDVARGVIVF
jgi:S-(hydroxymethyl)glutathione dehydrogenase / alcohol dehydrogenase